MSEIFLLVMLLVRAMSIFIDHTWIVALAGVFVGFYLRHRE